MIASSENGTTFPMTPTRWVATLLGVGVVYFGAGLLGLSFASVNASASPVWPPTGIAIAAILLFGPRIWPALLAGAFLFNVYTAGTAATSLSIAAGNTLEGLIGAGLTKRFSGGRAAFLQPAGILKFSLLFVPIAAATSATIGIATLVAAGLAPSHLAGDIWLTWWLGDGVGALVVTPLIILWSRPSQMDTNLAKMIEGVLLLGLLLATSVLVFSTNFPSSYLVVPFLLWTALSFGPRESITAAALIDALAVEGTIRGRGPFNLPDPNQSLLVLQGFVAVATFVSLVLSTVVLGRRTADRQVRKSRDELEGRVLERTAELARSEARLREAQGLAHVGSWDWDVAQNRVTWSEELFRIYGIDRSRFNETYEGFRLLVHPDDRRLFDDAVRWKSGAAFDFDHRIVRGDGKTRWLHSRGTAARGTGGNMARVSGTAQDVTERHEAESKFRSLVESAPDPLVITDDRGAILLVNEQVENVLGYARGDLIGKPVEILVPDDVRPRHAGLRQAYMADPRRRPMGAGRRLNARHRDGHEVPVEISLSPIQTPDGIIVAAAMRDVTERFKAEEERLAAAAQLQELENLRRVDQFKTQFINNAAHELRTPLSPMVTQVYLLSRDLEKQLTGPHRAGLEILQRNLKRLQELVEDLLESARYQAGRLFVDPTPGDWHRTAKEVVESFRPAAQEKGLQLSLLVEGDGAFVHDSKRIAQVLTNLLSNAIKFTPASGHIWVTSRTGPDGAALVVRDSGIGMTALDLQKIFQPFVQVHDLMQVTSKGSGLGLYISRGIAQSHGGTLTAKSPSLGKGSEFTLTVPPWKAASPAAPAAGASLPSDPTLRAPEVPTW